MNIESKLSFKPHASLTTCYDRRSHLDIRKDFNITSYPKSETVESTKETLKAIVDDIKSTEIKSCSPLKEEKSFLDNPKSKKKISLNA